MSIQIKYFLSQVSIKTIASLFVTALLSLGGYLWLQLKAVPVELIIHFFVPIILFGASELYRLIRRPKSTKAITLAGSSITFIAIYIISWYIFFLISDQGRLYNSAALTMPVIILLGGIVLRGAYAYDQLHKTEHSNEVGHSVSGVVVEKKSIGSEFILIHNLNLRNGDGLWVPPGGHYDPRSTEPFDALRLKLVQEIGFECSHISPLSDSLAAEVRGHDTSLAKAFESPLLYLRENLQGTCKENHSIHVAAVYVCKVEKPILIGREKYGATQQIRIPVEKCLHSTQSAREAVCQAVSDWSFCNSGVRPGAYPDVPDDVPWRLHLASKMLKCSGFV